MENALEWTVVEHVIHNAIRNYDDEICGLSLEMTIANDLREAGLISG